MPERTQDPQCRLRWTQLLSCEPRPARFKPLRAHDFGVVFDAAGCERLIGPGEPGMERGDGLLERHRIGRYRYGTCI